MLFPPLCDHTLMSLFTSLACEGFELVGNYSESLNQKYEFEKFEALVFVSVNSFNI